LVVLGKIKREFNQKENPGKPKFQPREKCTPSPKRRKGPWRGLLRQ